MSKIKTALTQNMVVTATEFGIAVVEEMAKEALQQKPNISLKDFVSVLNQAKSKMRKTVIDPS